LEGVPVVEEAISLALTLRKRASELGFNVLYDARKMSVPLSVMPAYDFSTKLSSLLSSSVERSVKVAFLYERGEKDDHWNFWETVSTNRGLMFKGFTEEEKAIDWLAIDWLSG
jgi:hypothetical protein